jgi:hypothetical protein
VLVADAGALLRREEAPELDRLARAGHAPLGRGAERRRVLSPSGELLGTTRIDHLRLDPATGEVSMEVLPRRVHAVWRAAFSLLDLGLLDWIREGLQERSLELLPQRLRAGVILPIRSVRAADREGVILEAEGAEAIERHCRQLAESARAQVSRVKEGVARTRPFVARARAAGADLARRGTGRFLSGQTRAGAAGALGPAPTEGDSVSDS